MIEKSSEQFAPQAYIGWRAKRRRAALGSAAAAKGIRSAVLLSKVRGV